MSSIKVEPSKIHFESAQPGNLYVMSISVRNMTTIAQRIRLVAPKSGIFALNYIPSGAIAPGLDLRAEIECLIPKELGDSIFTDKIIAVIGDEKIDVPIIAVKPHAEVKFEQSFILGNILLNQSIIKEIPFENTSDIDGTVKLSVPKGAAIRISHTKFDLKPRGHPDCRQVLRVTLDAKETGLVREMIKVSVVGALTDSRIDFSAQVIEQALTVLTVNQKGLLELAQFGKIFFGEAKTMDALLTNSGPLPLGFSMKYDDEDESGNSQSETLENYHKSLTISPMDGIVKPFSSIPLKITFSPKQYIPEKGFIQQLTESDEFSVISRTVKIDCLDSNQTISLPLEGTAFVPSLSVSPNLLRFGECPVNDRRDIIMNVQNNTKLPMKYEFPNVATFKFEPRSGKLLPNESISVIASFLPPQLGVFKTTVRVSFCGNLKTVDLMVQGESNSVGPKKTLVGGTDKLPIDFTAKHKFVNTEELTTALAEKKKEKDLKKMELENTVRNIMLQSSKSNFVLSNDIKPLTQDMLDVPELPSIIDASKERDDIYGTDQIIQKKKTMEDELNEMIMKHHKEHNKYYNNFLQESFTRREVMKLVKQKQKMMERGAVDFTDPFGINMGMERGLEEPQLKAPKANEPLWMIGAGAGEGGATKGRLPTDENRLIQKKYSSQPATQAEMRDCSTELTIEALKQVTSSHKMINYGKVCVGSFSAKNFVISNGLKHSIMVTIEDLPIELQQSKPLCQVIPEGGMAGFDIYYSNRILGESKVAFTWKVNGIHAFKAHVMAEVVPIELKMNKSELIYEFPSDSLKPTLSNDIILTNPGNSPAEFLWGSVGAFTCDPEKGSIAAGKSTVVTITWDSLAGKRAEEEIGLHITGGIDQVLKVKGLLPETKAEFADKRLNLGTMAVGTEREINATINNVGANPLVYFVNQPDDSLGIKIEPMEACILPGESGEIKLSIIPKSARSYDNTHITAKIRGGKNIVLRLSGSSIIPQVELLEENYRFGDVTVGSSIRLPLTLKNKSPIAANLVLDLNSYPDFSPFLLNQMDEPDFATKEFGSVSTSQEDEFGNTILLMNNNGTSSPMKSAVLLSGSNSAAKKGTGADDRSSSPKKGSTNKKKVTVMNLWKITIPANATLKGELIFRPTIAKKYQYKLPLYLYGLKENITLQRDVNALGIANLVSISNYVVDFGDRVVSRDPLSRVSYFLETTLTNISNVGVSFIITEEKEMMCNLDGTPIPPPEPPTTKKGSKDAAANNDMNEAQQIFFVSPLKIDLPPGQSSKLRVTFQPQQDATYHKKLGVYLKTSEEKINTKERPYLTLLCVGSGVYPCLSLSTQNLQLPTVPLGVTTRNIFTIYNHGYASLDIKHRVSPGIPVNLEVSYPDGNQVGIMVEKIRIIVSTKSEIPISWSGKLEFYDMDGERFFLMVTGCVDNCLLSNYSFVKDYSNDYGFIGLDEQPVYFLPQTTIAEMRAIESKRKEELRKLRSLERQRLVEGKTSGAASKKGPGSDGSVLSASASERSLTKGKSPKGSSVKNVKMNLDNTSDDGSVRAVNTIDGIDVEKLFTNLTSPEYINACQHLEETEAVFLLKWLNLTICRKMIDPDRFPFSILESNGDLIVDCIEQMSGKRIPNLKQPAQNEGYGRRSSNNSTSNNSNNQAESKRGSEKIKQLNIIEKVIYKYQAIINFLINHGALLTHINSINLLNLDEHLFIQEYEILRDKSVRITPAVLNNRRLTWQEEWLSVCRKSWLEILYQSIKVFVLSRLNFRDYAQLPGVVINPAPSLGGNALTNGNSSSAPSNALTKKGGKEANKNPSNNIPKDLQGSNIFTNGELILLAWISFHLEHAEHCIDEGVKENKNGGNSLSSALDSLSFNKRVFDIEQTFRDFFPYCQLIHSHISDIGQKGEPLYGYTTLDRQTRQEEIYLKLEETMNLYHLSLPNLTSEDIIISGRNKLLLLLHFYLTLPNLIPKTKVEFKGMLGNPIMKKIEIRNPSKKPLVYQIELKDSVVLSSGNSNDSNNHSQNPNHEPPMKDFGVESSTLIIPPESTIDYLVTLNAHFMHKISSKIYFWNIKSAELQTHQQGSQDNDSNNLSKVIQQLQIQGGETDDVATGHHLCFQLFSNIIGISPIEVFQKTLTLYDCDHQNITIKNMYPTDVQYHLRLEVKHAPKTIQDYLITNNLSNTKKKNPQNSKPDNFKDVPTQRPINPNEELLASSSLAHKGSIKEDDWDLENILLQPFWLSEESFIIPKGTSKLINISYLPFMLGKYKCSIVVSNEQLGEFAYEINLQVDLPRPADKLNIELLSNPYAFQEAADQANPVSQIKSFYLYFNGKNPNFEKSYNIITEQRIKNPNKKIRARNILFSFLSSNVSNNLPPGVPSSSQFLLDFTNNFFNYQRKLLLTSEYMKASNPSSVSGKENGAKEGGKVRKITRNYFEFPPPETPSEESPNPSANLNRQFITFIPEEIGAYKTIAVVYPEDNPRDIRCIEINIQNKLPDLKTSIEFRGPARKQIIQEIPIPNQTDSDWILSLSLGTTSGINPFNSKVFYLPKTLSIPKHSTTNLSLVFYSLIEGHFESKLVLRNSDTNDIFEYILIAQAEEPLVEETLSFSAPARKKTKFSLTLPSFQSFFITNSTDLAAAAIVQKLLTDSSRKFQLTTDIPYVSYSPLLETNSNGPIVELTTEESSHFDFYVNSPVSGDLTGTMTFTHREYGLSFWFIVSCEISSPNEEKTIEIASIVRKAAMVNISLSNPLNRELTLQVFMQGDNLIGDNSFTLVPSSKEQEASSQGIVVNQYELIYSPLIAGNFSGKIKFYNEIVGEIWYKLNLIAIPAPPVVLEPIECMVGSEIVTYAYLENPLSESLTIQVNLTDIEHFRITGKVVDQLPNPSNNSFVRIVTPNSLTKSLSPSITLRPFQQTYLELIYLPSTFNEANYCQIQCTNNQLGEILYELEGKGLLPSVMPQVTIEGPLIEMTSENILFYNPFDLSLPIEISFEIEKSQIMSKPSGKDREKDSLGETSPVFSLLLRKSNEIVVNSKSIYHIPLAFSPQYLGMYRGNVLIRSLVNNHQLLWCYPVQGIAMNNMVHKLPLMEVQSKSTLMKDVTIPLNGLVLAKEAGPNQFAKLFPRLPAGGSGSGPGLALTDIVVDMKIPEELKNLVTRSFRFLPLEVLTQENPETPDQPLYSLRGRLLFEPLRIFTTNLDITIFIPNYGKWRNSIELRALDPEPDDIIRLTASVGAKDQVSFKLSNRFLGYSKFYAYFTSNSSPHFSVDPSHGYLPPYDSKESIQFVVTFAPKEYGVIETGTLNIVTEDAQWSYSIKGSYPDNALHIAANVKSKINSKR